MSITAVWSILFAPAKAQGAPLDVSNLVLALGGDAVVPAFYDWRVGVTAVNGASVSQWTDVRGPSGFAPSLAQATNSKRPQVTATGLSFDGLTHDLFTPTSTLFDLSGAYSLIVVGAFTNPTAAAWSCGIADSTAPTKALRIRSQPTNGIIGCQVVAAFAQSTVNVSSTVRLVVGSKNATTLDAFVDVPNTTQVTTTAAGTLASGALPLTVGAFFTGSLSPAPLIAKAVVCLARQVTAADLVLIKAWARDTHLAVLA